MTDENGDSSRGDNPSPGTSEWDETAHPHIDILEAVAAATDRDILDLPKLAQRVDTDALDSLLKSSGSDLTLEFNYTGVTVTVTPAGEIGIS